MPGMANLRTACGSQTRRCQIPSKEEVPGDGLTGEMPVCKEPRQTASIEDAAPRAQGHPAEFQPLPYLSERNNSRRDVQVFEVVHITRYQNAVSTLLRVQRLLLPWLNRPHRGMRADFERVCAWCEAWDDVWFCGVVCGVMRRTLSSANSDARASMGSNGLVLCHLDDSKRRSTQTLEGQ